MAKSWWEIQNEQRQARARTAKWRAARKHIGMPEVRKVDVGLLVALAYLVRDKTIALDDAQRNVLVNVAAD